MRTVLSWFTTRSCCTEKMRSKSFPLAGTKALSGLRRRDGKLAVQLGNAVLAQEAIGFLHRGDPAQSQLLRQPALPGAEVPLAASARLRRIRRNHLNAQITHGPSHLGQPLPVYDLSFFRRQPEVAAAIAIQSAENTALLDHGAQCRQRGGRGLLLHQLRIVDLAGGVIENYQQVLPLLSAQPAVRAGIDVQQHAGHRPPLALAPMRPAFARAEHQARTLQQTLDAGVAIGDAVLLAELLVKVPHAEIEILFAIQTQHLFDPRPRHTLGARPALSAVV